MEKLSSNCFKLVVIAVILLAGSAGTFGRVQEMTIMMPETFEIGKEDTLLKAFAEAIVSEQTTPHSTLNCLPRNAKVYCNWGGKSAECCTGRCFIGPNFGLCN